MIESLHVPFITAKSLRELPTVAKQVTIETYAAKIYEHVYDAALANKTSYFWQPNVQEYIQLTGDTVNGIQVTFEDVVDILQNRFIDCEVLKKTTRLPNGIVDEIGILIEWA